jgi:hypothetical protein
MPTCYLAPDPIQSTQLIPGGIVPANGGKLFFYTAGTSTKTTVYKDNAGGTSWTNPIVLDSGGNLPTGGEVWFLGGTAYKVIFAPSNDTDPPVSPYWTKDNLAGVNDIVASGVTLLSEWVTAPTATFVSATSFTFSGDQTAPGNADVGRRMKFTVTAGTVYGVISRTSFGGGLTTVTMNMTNGTLDAGLSAQFYSVLSAANAAVPWLNTAYPSFMDGADKTKLADVNISSAASSTTTHLLSTLDIPGIQSASTGASMVYLTTKTVTSVASLIITSTDVNWTLYDKYDIHIYNLQPVNNAVGFFARISEDGGTTFKSTNSYFGSVLLEGSNTSNFSIGFTTASAIQLSDAFGLNNSATRTYSAVVGINLPSDTAHFKNVTVREIAFLNTTQYLSGSGMGVWEGDTGAINGIQFIMGAGNISTGTFRVYGLKKS